MPRSSLVFLAGAAVYALLQTAGGVTFDATPLTIGIIALVAAVAGRSPGITATAFALIGWGLAVLLVRHGPLPDGREAAAFLVGAGAGLVAAHLLARSRRTRTLGDGSAVLVVGGLAFYFAFDFDWLLDWPVWAATLVAWAAWEAAGRRRV